MCGGGRVSEDVYQEFLRLAGGKNARLVHIPSAHPFASARDVRYRYSGWLSYNVASFKFLHTTDRDDADDADFIKPLETATGVWIGGGTQERLADLFHDTKTEAALRRVLERGGVIGGTSAGASIMSTCMIKTGTSTEAVCDRGFGLVSHCVIDQHFGERNRLPRLLRVLEEHQKLVGIGVEEGTALVVRENRIKVIGAGRATVCVPASAGSDVTLYRLRDGDEAQLSLAVGLAGKDTLAWELKRPARK
jgi:cyanophycinase